jgi:hypothetical protein
MLKIMRQSFNRDAHSFLESGVIEAVGGWSSELRKSVVSGFWLASILGAIAATGYAVGPWAGPVWVSILLVAIAIVLSQICLIQERVTPLAQNPANCQEALTLVETSPAAKAWRDAVLALGRELVNADLRCLLWLAYDEALRENTIIQFDTVEAQAANRRYNRNLVFGVLLGFAIMAFAFDTSTPMSVYGALAAVLGAFCVAGTSLWALDRSPITSSYRDASRATSLLRGDNADAVLRALFSTNGYVTTGQVAVAAERQSANVHRANAVCRQLHGLPVD